MQNIAIFVPYLKTYTIMKILADCVSVELRSSLCCILFTGLNLRFQRQVNIRICKFSASILLLVFFLGICIQNVNKAAKILLRNNAKIMTNLL